MPFVPDPLRIEVVDEAVAAILRSKTPAEWLAMAFDAFETAWQTTTAQVQRHFPSWPEDLARLEVARRISGGISLNPKAMP